MIRDLALILSVILSGSAFAVSLSARVSADEAAIRAENGRTPPQTQSPPEEGGALDDLRPEGRGALREFWA